MAARPIRYRQVVATIADATSVNDDENIEGAKIIYMAALEGGEAPPHRPFSAEIRFAVEGVFSILVTPQGLVGEHLNEHGPGFIGAFKIPDGLRGKRTLVRFTVWNDSGATRKYVKSIIYD